MQAETGKLSVREEVGYSFGDGVANFIFQTFMLLQLSFYTDTFGLSAAAAATLFLIARLWGAVCDPVFGALTDRTHTRWGKFRPWILWTAVPFGILGYFAFTTPDFSAAGKIIYAYLTYFLLLTVYSANNNSYSALAIIFFFVTFFTTKERIVPPPSQETSLRQDISDLLKNRQWVLMFFVFLFMFIFLSMRNSILLYFFKYYLSLDSQHAFLVNADNILLGLLSFVGMTGANTEIAWNTFSVINIISLLAALLGIALSNSLARKYGKRDVLRIWLTIAGIAAILYAFLPAAAVTPAFLLSVLFNFSWGVTMPLPWAMMADVADYSEWKNNRRAEGWYGNRRGTGRPSALKVRICSQCCSESGCYPWYQTYGKRLSCNNNPPLCGFAIYLWNQQKYRG